MFITTTLFYIPTITFSDHFATFHFCSLSKNYILFLFLVIPQKVYIFVFVIYSLTNFRSITLLLIKNTGRYIDRL